jgi:uncharacterized protein (DUF169 family)
MAINETLEIYRYSAQRMVSILNLSYPPVGVSMDMEGSCNLDESHAGQTLEHHRYCQAFMMARHGKKVVLDASGISCPAAAAAFGFRPLPEGLARGKGLVGFGIVSDPDVGHQMFAGMTTLPSGSLMRLHLYPLTEADRIPDVIIIEDEVEKLMWINLAYLHNQRGNRVFSSTAVLQATCVDSTLIPYVEKRLNFSFGCYGCRDATDMAPGEGILGFPSGQLSGITDHLEYLAQKTIPTSRGKRSFRALIGDRNQEAI